MAGRRAGSGRQGRSAPRRDSVRARCVCARSQSVRDRPSSPSHDDGSVGTILRIGAVVLQVADTTRSGEFWSRALGWSALPTPTSSCRPHQATVCASTDESDRTHLDLWTDSPREQAAEVERLVGLGATRVEWDYPQDADFVVLADPVGTLFFVIDTSR